MIYQNREDLIRLTSLWKGERFEDGRPRVGDDLLHRIRNLTIEDVWVPLWQSGYKHQFQGDLRRTNTETRLLGRAVTMVMVPSRPDVHMVLLTYGHQELNKFGYFNEWVINALQEKDVLVVDMCDKVFQGTFLGGNMGAVIQSRTKTGGAVVWGGIHDLEQLAMMEGIQIYFRGCDPTPIQDMMASSVNAPCSVGSAICMPGDVVLGTVSGIIFIPAHMVETVAVAGEKQQIKDMFGFERLKDGKYLSSEVDVPVWPWEIMEDFLQWFKTSSQAQPFQHLEWKNEIEKSRAGERCEWTGLSVTNGYSFLEKRD